MLRSFFCCKSASVLFVAVLLCHWPLSAQGQPKAVIAQSIHDFGDVAQGEVLTTDFVIENQGDAELLIHEVHAPCSCTVVDYDRSIAPGEKGNISVRLDTAPILGGTSKNVIVLTNDPSNPRFDLTVRVLATPHVSADPGYVRYVIVQGFDEDSTVAQTLYSHGGKPFRITSVESPLPNIKVTFREAREAERLADRPGPQWRVESTIDPDSPVGALTGYIKVNLEHEKQSALSIPVSGFVRPVLAATPYNIDFKSLKVDEPIKASTYIRNFATEEIELLRTETQIEGLEADIQTEKKGREYYLVLTLKPGAAGPFSGTVRIYTSSSRKPTLDVPVTGTRL